MSKPEQSVPFLGQWGKPRLLWAQGCRQGCSITTAAQWSCTDPAHTYWNSSLLLPWQLQMMTCIKEVPKFTWGFGRHRNKLSAHTAAVLQGRRGAWWRKEKNVHGQLIFFRQFTPHTSNTRRRGKKAKKKTRCILYTAFLCLSLLDSFILRNQVIWILMCSTAGIQSLFFTH